MHGTRRIPRLPVLALAAAAAVSCIGLVATPASAATAATGGNTLGIDAGTTVRPVTYAGAGGLYALADATTPPASVLSPTASEAVDAAGARRSAARQRRDRPHR